MSYIKGRHYEYLMKKKLEKEGYKVIRAAGSHGEWDLVAIHPILREIKLLQIKYKKKHLSKEKLSILGNYMVYAGTVIIGKKKKSKKRRRRKKKSWQRIHHQA